MPETMDNASYEERVRRLLEMAKIVALTPQLRDGLCHCPSCERARDAARTGAPADGWSCAEEEERYNAMQDAGMEKAVDEPPRPGPQPGTACSTCGADDVRLEQRRMPDNSTAWLCPDCRDKYFGPPRPEEDGLEYA